MKLARDLLAHIDRAVPFIPVIIEINGELRRGSILTQVLSSKYIPATIKAYFSKVTSTRLKKLSRVRVLGRGLVATILPREVILDLERDPNVSRVYLDHVRRLPELPPSLFSSLFSIATESLGMVREDIRALIEMRLNRSNSTAQMVSTSKVADDMGVTKYHKQGLTGQGIKIAVVDTGATPVVFNRHPQARGVVTEYDTAYGVSGDTNGHGTHVFTIATGLPAEVNNKATGGLPMKVTGMAPGATKIIVKGLSTPMGFGSDSTVIEAIVRAIELGADIINLSLGSDPEDPEADVLVRFIEGIGVSYPNILFVAASGNDGANRISSPANAKNAIAIGAYDSIRQEVARFSNRGEGLDFIAPGVDILSGIQHGTLLDGLGEAGAGWAILSGTSMATPVASGILAIVKQYFRLKHNKELTWQDVLSIAEAKSKEQGIEWTPDKGWGLIKPDIFISQTNLAS